MKRSSFKKKYFIFSVLSFLCPAVILSIFFFLLGMMPGQELNIARGDYINQFYPFYYHFWDSIFHGYSLEYSFSAGMGTPTMAAYAYYVYSPFSILPYVFNNITLAFWLSLVLKISFSSFSFYEYSNKILKCKCEIGLLFSLLYSLSSYISIYYINIQFLDVMYILPLLICFLFRFIKTGKGIMLVLCYAYCFSNNFFNGFCVGIYSLICFLALLYYFQYNGKKLAFTIIRYVVIVCCALMLSCPFVLPAIYFVVNHMPSGSDFSRIPLNNPLESSLSLLFGRNDFGIFQLLPAIYCGWGAFINFIFFFFSKANDVKKKITVGIPSAFLIICILWHPAYLMMHLFNEPDSFPWRFSYLAIFLITSVGAYQFGKRDMHYLSLRHFVSVASMVIYIVISYIVCKGMVFVSPKVLAINAVFILLLSCFYNRPKITYFVCFLEVLVSVFLQLSVQTNSLPQNQQLIQEKIDAVGESVYEFQSEYNNDIMWRMCCNVPSVNASMIYNYRDLNYFSSFNDLNLVYALDKLGLLARSQQYNDIGLTEFTRMIFSVRFTLEDSNEACII